MELQFINHEEWGIEPDDFTPAIKKLEKAIDTYQGILNIVFVNDKYIQALNKNYREKDQPTDVLSFNYWDKNPDSPEELIGEIYISIETAERQAKEFKHSLSDEIRRLLIHGLLHIHGYDHEEDEDYEVMNKLEEGILG